MKKLLPIVALAAIVASGSCSKIQDKVASATAVNFSHGYSEELALPAGTISADTVTPLPFKLPLVLPYSFATNLGQILSDNNTSAEKLTSVRLSELKLGITVPAGSNLNFLDTVQVYMAANGIPEVLAGQKSPVPRNVNSINLDLNDVEMRQFFLKDSIQVKIRGVFNAAPANSTKLSFGTRFNIKAEPLR